jgi:hypothetical protein
MHLCGLKLPPELERYRPFLDLSLPEAIAAWEKSRSSLGEAASIEAPPPSVSKPKAPVEIRGPDDDVLLWKKNKGRLPRAEYYVVKALVEVHARGERLSIDKLRTATKDGEGNVVEDPLGALKRLRQRDDDWKNVIDMAGMRGRGYGLNDKPLSQHTHKNPPKHPRRPTKG